MDELPTMMLQSTGDALDCVSQAADDTDIANVDSLFTLSPEHHVRRKSSYVSPRTLEQESMLFPANFQVLPGGVRQNINGKWCCDICNRLEDSKDDLITHRIMHLSGKGNECPICKKTFATQTNVRNHLTVHTGVKKYKCRFCDRRFGWKTQLVTHEHVHTGKGLHHCAVCDKPFMTKWLLKRHAKVHVRHGETRSSMMADIVLASAKELKKKRRKLSSLFSPRMVIPQGSSSPMLMTPDGRFPMPVTAAAPSVGISYQPVPMATALPMHTPASNAQVYSSALFALPSTLPTPMSTLHTEYSSASSFPPGSKQNPSNATKTSYPTSAEVHIPRHMRRTGLVSVPDKPALSGFSEIKCHFCNQLFSDQSNFLHHVDNCRFSSSGTSSAAAKPAAGVAGGQRDATIGASSDGGWQASKSSKSHSNIEDDLSVEADKHRSGAKSQTSKGALKTILSKLHHKADDQKRSESVKVEVLDDDVSLIPQSPDFHVTSDSMDAGGGGAALGDLSEQGSSDDDYEREPPGAADKLVNAGTDESLSSQLDPFISGLENGLEHGRNDLYTFEALEIVRPSERSGRTTSLDAKADRLPATLSFESVQKLLERQQECLVRVFNKHACRQKDELDKLHALHAHQHAEHQRDVQMLSRKLDNLNHVITTQTQLLNKLLMNGKLSVVGTLNFSACEQENGR